MRTITSRDNKYIKECIKLKNRKYRDSRGLFIIEGTKLIFEALACSAVKFHYIIIDESIEMINLPEFSCEVFLVNHRLMEEISDTDTPQGIVAVVQKPGWDLETIKSNNSFLLLLDAIKDPGNMGTIIRTAWAFGVDGILLTPGCADPYSHKVVRSTMGGIFNIPVFQNITISDIDDFKNVGYKIVSSSIKNAVNYYDFQYTKPSILVIGSEAHGVSQPILEKTDVLVTIPINPCVDSLNAAIACGIILSESWKQQII